MLAEFWQAISKTITAAGGVQELKVRDPRKAFFQVGGTMLEHDLPPTPRAHRVFSLDDFVRAVRTWSAPPALEHDAQPSVSSATVRRSVIWHGDGRLVFVLDDADRLDAVTLELEPTGEFQLLAGLEDEPRAFSQKEFCGLLKCELCHAAPEFLLPRCRKIEAMVGTRTLGEVGQGRDRGVKEFQAEIAGSADIPEYVDLSVMPWRNLPLEPQSIRCSFDVTIAAQASFVLRPLPDSLERLLQESHRKLGELLTAAVPPAIPVIYGKP